MRYEFREKPARSSDAAVLRSDERVACTLSAVDWSARLRSAPDAEIFAEVFGAHGSVLLPPGNASQGAFAEVELRGLALKGRIAATDLPLGLRRSALLDGYIWTQGTKALTWQRATAAGVELGLGLGPRVRPVRGLPTVVRRCEELTLEAESLGAFEIESVLPGRKTVWETEWIGDQLVPLSLASGGPPVAYLDTRPESTDHSPESALVIEKRRNTLRVLYQIEDGVVMGWVPAAALRAVGEIVEVESGFLFFGDPNAPTAPFGVDDPTRQSESGETELSMPACAWNAPLTVEASGNWRQVGVISSGIPLVLGVERDGLREVTLEHPSVTWYPAAKIHVPERLLYPCPGRGVSGR